MRRILATFVVALALSSLLGCDKLKGALGKGGDGGAGTTGTGLLSFLGTDFEGEIAANITTKGKNPKGPQQVVFGIKKPKYRIDIAEPSVTSTTAGFATRSGGSIILDPPTKKGWLLVPAQKMAMVIDLDKMKDMKGHLPGVPSAPKGVPTSVPSAPPKIDKTGKKDVVAGYSCEIWNISSDGKRAEACVAEGITWIDLGDLGFGSPELALAVLASEANRFPLRVVTFDAQGAEETRMEATKIDKKKLDDTRFVVPPDYRTVDMAAMFSGLGALGAKGIPSFNVAPPKPR